MRTSLRLCVLSLVAASLVACGDRETLPTGIAPREANEDRIGFFIDPNQFVSISAGSDFTCAIQNFGTTYCWGKNDYWQVGRSSKGTCYNDPRRLACIPRPTLLRKGTDNTPLNLADVDGGGTHGCGAERITMQVWCWGAGGIGQLGLGASIERNYANPVPGMTNTSLMSAGKYASCAQKADGVFCWGRLRPQGGDAFSPARWEVSPNYLGLSVGERHACAIQAPDRSVVCWGDNTHGQLGNSLGNLGQQMPIGTLFASPVDAVITQDNTTCVAMNGATQCAGRNWFGMFGSNTALGSSTATPTMRTAGGALFGITVGEHHACGLDANGAAFCWGNGALGQLGNNTWLPSTSPQPVFGNRKYRAIAAGSNHTCAIGTDNLLYCWGANDHGQLGAWTTNSKVPMPTEAPVL